MDRNELTLEPHHLGVPSILSKMIPEPMVHLAQTVHLSCTNTNTISKWTETRFDMTHITRSSIGCVQNDFWAYGMFSGNFVPILSQDLHYLQTEWNELPLGVPSGASKTILEPMVHLAQAVHLSCTNTNTISEQTQMRFHMTHITEEFHWVLQDDFQAYGTFNANCAPILRKD
jgi:hypothetical protein